MPELTPLAASLAAGLLLGGIFFGGLWLTVRKALASQRPALWFLCSLLLRMSVALGGFFVVADGRWERLSACLVGFVLARFFITRLTKSQAGDPQNHSREVNHAP